MWGRIIALGALGAGSLWLGGCATMSEEQCLAGDWSARGYADGAEGFPMSRLAEHAEACAKHGVTPDEAPYRSGREAGLLVYCTRDRGFREGREGAAYQQVCPRDLEAEFLPAYEDGRVVYAAESALQSAVSSVNGYASRLEELDGKIEAKRRECRDESLPQPERDKACDRVGELQGERRGVHRDWEDARDEAAWAEREAREVRYRFSGLYGDW